MALEKRPPTQDTSCRRRRLSQRGPFLVEACGCGMLHLTFGFLTLRIAPQAFDALCAVLLEASAQMERPQSATH
jgi:hypothetical protein